jgi:hypothetical protein
MRKYTLLGGGAAALAIVLLSTGPALAAGSWNIVPNPPGAFFTGVAAQSDTNAWGVGGPQANSGDIVHWNGTSWTQTPTPSVPQSTVMLNAASASSPSDAWAVGRITETNQNHYRITTTLAYHWNGSSWAITSTPRIAGSDLMSVADISPTDAYAIGLGGALQWNGSTWSAFAVPAPGGASPATLGAVAAGGANDVWIAGLYYDTATASDEPFTAHFNGTAWSAVPAPVNGGQFFGLTVVNPNDTWMVGYSAAGGSLIENWNGSSWQVIPNPGTGGLLSVTATSANNVTAVGGINQGASVLNWNGSAWSTVPVPQAGDSDAIYSTSAALGGQLTWAFGRSTTGFAVSEITLLNG